MKELKRRIAEQMVYIDMELIDMGDHYGDTVEYLCEKAGIPYVDFEDDEKEKALAAYEILAVKNPKEILFLIDMLYEEKCWEIDELYVRMKYQKEIDVNKHPTIIALKTLVEYVEHAQKEGFAVEDLLKVMNSYLQLFMESDLEATRAAYLVANEYWRHLDVKYYGICSNGAYKVGGTVGPIDMKDELLKNYLYHAKAEFSDYLLKAGYALFFKRDVVEIHSYSREKCECLYEYKDTGERISLEGSIEETGLRLAEKLNELAKEYVDGHKQKK